MNDSRTGSNAPRGYTLIELMVTLVIISILASLTLGGLAVARQRVKRDRTEMTIRKIHEVVMPHYELFLTRSVPMPPYTPPAVADPATRAVLESLGRKAVNLIARRRLMALELPDGWKDLVPVAASATQPLWTPTGYETAVSRRLREIRPTLPEASAAAAQYSDAECLWLSVMRGGYADPSIIGHFRNDEFSDKDGDGQREFVDGWGNPIRFLRWAPAFVSKYQPLPDAESTETRSHDAIDAAGLDPLARNTLFPLIFSTGPDGEPDIACRDDESGGAFTYPAVAFDPYFFARGPTGSHLQIKVRGAADSLGRYGAADAEQYRAPERVFGNLKAGRTPDDVHNHSMSR